MRTSDCDILIVPDAGGAGPDHWLSRWERQLSTARRVKRPDWDAPDLARWASRLVDAASVAARPCVLVAHGFGAHVAARAAPRIATATRGAFLVAPVDLGEDGAPLAPLPFPSLVVASRDDPRCRYERAQALAEAWGATIVDAGAAGGLDEAAGYGPWPEGLMRFAGLLKRL